MTRGVTREYKPRHARAQTLTRPPVSQQPSKTPFAVGPVSILSLFAREATQGACQELLGIIRRLGDVEDRAEELLVRPFELLFAEPVQPVELAAAVRRECDRRAAALGRDCVVVPNDFDIELGRGDYVRLAADAPALTAALAAVVRRYAAAQGYTLIGPSRGTPGGA